MKQVYTLDLNTGGTGGLSSSSLIVPSRSRLLQSKIQISGLNPSKDGTLCYVYAWLTLNKQIVIQDGRQGAQSMLDFQLYSINAAGEADAYTLGMPTPQFHELPAQSPLHLCLQVNANIGSGTAYAECLLWLQPL